MAVFTAIDDPSAYFKVQLYTGDGNDSRTITFDDTDTDMQPDMIWIKERSSTSSHYLTDSVRGIGKKLEPDGTGAESTEGLSAVTSDGFTIGTSTNQVNQDTITHVAWCWKESATAGFDIVAHTHSGDSSEPSHSLGAAPNFIIWKPRGATGSWGVATTPTGITSGYLSLNSTGAFVTESGHVDAADASTITYGQYLTDTTTITYAWRSIQGFSKFGSYTGNGNADGTFVYTGFRPAYFMDKRTDSTSSWIIIDNKMNPNNDGAVTNQWAEGAYADNTNNYGFDILSNGIKIRDTTNNLNTSGGNYIFLCFAEAPFVNSKGVPCNAR